MPRGLRVGGVYSSSGALFWGGWFVRFGGWWLKCFEGWKIGVSNSFSVVEKTIGGLGFFVCDYCGRMGRGDVVCGVWQLG